MASKAQTEMVTTVQEFVDTMIDEFAAFIIGGTFSDVPEVRDSLAKVNNLVNGLVREHDKGCKDENNRVHKPRGRKASEDKPSGREAILAQLGLG